MKFETGDQRYLSMRREFSERVGPSELWSVIDHWPLYCGIANLGRFLAISDLMRTTLEVPGHVAEFGTWRGANLMFLTKLLRILDPHGCKVVHGFDSFEGLSRFSDQDGEAAAMAGAYKGNYEELSELIALYELSDDIVLHRGLIEETLPALLEREPALIFSFVFCDTDLYESTRELLELLHPRLAKGGVFVFDQWNRADYPGEGVAVNEFLAVHGDSYAVAHVKHARQPTLYLRKTADGAK